MCQSPPPGRALPIFFNNNNNNNITDHCPSFYRFVRPIRNNSNKVKLSFRSHNPGNTNKFIETLSLKKWSFPDCEDISEQVVCFVDIVNELCKKCFPVKTKYVSLKRLSNQWIRSGIIKSILLLLFEVRCTRPGESEKTISPKTPTPHNQPMEERKR